MASRIFKYLLLLLTSLSLFGCISSKSISALRDGISVGYKVGVAKRLIATGKYAQAEEQLKQALASCDDMQKVVGDEMRAMILERYGELYMKQHRYPEAAEKFEAALKNYESFSPSLLKKLRKLRENKAECLDQYAMLLRAMGQPQKAEGLEAQAQELRSSLE